MVSHWVS